MPSPRLRSATRPAQGTQQVQLHSPATEAVTEPNKNWLTWCYS